MSSYNRVTLIGNLTRTPELRKTKSDNSVTELGLALNRAWYNENGQKQEDVTFVDVTLWGRNAENAVQYLQKGRSVLVEGRLQLETWQDKQSGQDRSKLKVVADLIQFLGGGQDRSAASGEDAPETRGTADDPAERSPREEEEEREERNDRRVRRSTAERSENVAPERRSAERSGRRSEERRVRARHPVA